VQRPTMNFVAIKTPQQMDLLALHRVRSRLVGQLRPAESTRHVWQQSKSGPWKGDRR
jgi:transposase